MYDADFGLIEQLNSNEWQQAEKIVKLLEPVQRVTKELSAKEAMLSQVIPFIEILKMELDSTGDDDRGIISTKEEMLKSLKSPFEHVCSVLLLLYWTQGLKPHFMMLRQLNLPYKHLLNCVKAQMISKIKCQSHKILKIHNKQLEECVDNTEPTSTETSESITTTTTSEKKKQISIWESYKKAVKILAKPTSSSHPLSFQERVSTMVTDYLNEPVTENPINKKFMDPLEYWINNKECYPVLATIPLQE